jgi:hypothetical protein
VRFFTQIAVTLLVAALFSGVNCFESCLFQFQKEIASATEKAKKPCHGSHTDSQKEAPSCAHRELVAEKQSSDGLSLKASHEASTPVYAAFPLERVVLVEHVVSFSSGPPGPMRSPSKSVLRI